MSLSGERITSIKFVPHDEKTIQFWVNDSISYLDIEEAVELQYNLAAAVIKAVFDIDKASPFAPMKDNLLGSIAKYRQLNGDNKEKFRAAIQNAKII